MNTARELKRRCSGGSTFADGAKRGQAPANAVAYGSALRERSFSTGFRSGLGRRSSSLRGTVSGGRRNSESASTTACCGAASNSAEKTGRDGLSPYTSQAPEAARLSATKPSLEAAPFSRIAACTAAAEKVNEETAMPAAVKSST